MILNFADKETERIWDGNVSRRLPIAIQAIARRKLRMINNARRLDDLPYFPQVESRIWREFPVQTGGR